MPSTRLINVLSPYRLTLVALLVAAVLAAHPGVAHAVATDDPHSELESGPSEADRAPDAAAVATASVPPPAAGEPALAPSLDAEAIRAALAELGHPDPAIRREAFERLMGMNRADLETFRAAVEQARPLLPAQAAVLREIVCQAYLSGEPYKALPKAGFLGVRLQVVALNTPAGNPAAPPPPPPFVLPPAEGGQAPPGAPRAGIMIYERVPGFCGARFLMEGDVVLSVVGRRIRMTIDRSELDLTREFSMVVREFGPGATVTFELLRQGRVMRVPVRLDAKPEAVEQDLLAGGNALDQFKNARRQKADRYWNETFRPLLGEQVG